MSKSATMKMVDGRQMICFPDGAQFFLMRNARKYAKRKGFSIPGVKSNPDAKWRLIETPEQERERTERERREAEALRRAREEAAQARAEEERLKKRRVLVRPSGTEVLAPGQTSRGHRREVAKDVSGLLRPKSGRTKNPKGRLADLPKLPAPYQYVDVTTMRDGTTVFTARVRGEKQVLGPFKLAGDSVHYNVDGFRVKSPATTAGLRDALSFYYSLMPADGSQG